MGRDKNQGKPIDSMEGKFSEIRDQLQKLMEGLTSMNVGNAQTDKELLEIKAATRFIKQYDKGMASSFDGESAGPLRMGRSKEAQTSSAPTGNSSFTRYSRLDFPHFSIHDLKYWLYKVDHIFFHGGNRI